MYMSKPSTRGKQTAAMFVHDHVPGGVYRKHSAVASFDFLQSCNVCSAGIENYVCCLLFSLFNKSKFGKDEKNPEYKIISKGLPNNLFTVINTNYEQQQ